MTRSNEALLGSLCPVRELRSPNTSPCNGHQETLPGSEECLSEAMTKRVYDLKNDEELKAAYWEAARGGAAGASKVRILHAIFHLVL